MHVSLSAASSFPTQSFLSHLIPPLSQANTNMSCFVHFAISSSHHTLSSIKFPPKVLRFFLSQTHKTQSHHNLGPSLISDTNPPFHAHTHTHTLFVSNSPPVHKVIISPPMRSLSAIMLKTILLTEHINTIDINQTIYETNIPPRNTNNTI